MSDRGNKGGQMRGKSRSRFSRAGQKCRFSHIERLLKKGNYAERVTKNAPIYLAAVLDYLVAEVLEPAGDIARANLWNRILPRHLQIAFDTEEELDKLIYELPMSLDDVLPNI
ncbi:hypothetical protein TNCT_248241 [Trichonephila clavata]|uniref:Histone H2A n=1 Tax=Trichonephila clavata TaxID=2740835 RepID=A0A8X6G9P4_TRICU|nr:hypothetical protein TNCT_248241 [Trichonephila clavata]